MLPNLRTPLKMLTLLLRADEGIKFPSSSPISIIKTRPTGSPGPLLPHNLRSRQSFAVDRCKRNLQFPLLVSRWKSESQGTF